MGVAAGASEQRGNAFAGLRSGSKGQDLERGADVARAVVVAPGGEIKKVEDPWRFGVVNIRKEKIVYIKEKPKKPKITSLLLRSDEASPGEKQGHGESGGGDGYGGPGQTEEWDDQNFPGKSKPGHGEIDDNFIRR